MIITWTTTIVLASVAQLDAPSDWRPGGCGFNPRRGRQHSFMEIDHEIFSTVILSLQLIQEGQLSVSGERMCKRMCTILVNRLEDYACPVNMWLGKLTALDMTSLGWLGRKTSTQTNRCRFPWRFKGWPHSGPFSVTPFRTIFSASTQRQSTHQCCQHFD